MLVASTLAELGRLDVFVKGTDGRLGHRWYGSGWSAWEPLGGALTGGPAVASWAAGRLDVVVTGADGQAWHKWFDGAWHGYEDLAGTLDSGPTSVSWSSNRIDVVARSGTDLTHTYWEP